MSGTYWATFTPQAWVNNYAVDVDPEGETRWEVSDRDTAADILAAAHEDDTYALDCDDRLKDDAGAPDWVRAWRGPFCIHVELEDEGAR